jgi:hypothetical protein
LQTLLLLGPATGAYVDWINIVTWSSIKPLVATFSSQIFSRHILEELHKISEDGAYCVLCITFQGQSDANQIPKFVQVPFRDWMNAMCNKRERLKWERSKGVGNERQFCIGFKFEKNFCHTVINHTIEKWRLIASIWNVFSALLLTAKYKLILCTREKIIAERIYLFSDRRFLWICSTKTYRCRNYYVNMGKATMVVQPLPVKCQYKLILCTREKIIAERIFFRNMLFQCFVKLCFLIDKVHNISVFF